MVSSSFVRVMEIRESFKAQSGIGAVAGSEHIPYLSLSSERFNCLFVVKSPAFDLLFAIGV
jgi:hypothetical protein